jgi:hypothetical protein
VPDCQETVTYQATSTSPFFSFDVAVNKITISGSDLMQAGIFTIDIIGTAAISRTEKKITL